VKEEMEKGEERLEIRILRLISIEFNRYFNYSHYTLKF